MTVGAQNLLQTWSAPIGVNVSLCVASLIYIRGWVHLRKVSSNLLSAWRLAAFLAGIVAIWIAIASPFAALDDVSLSVHMIQHLLLMNIAAPLILLGAPVLPLLHGLPMLLARRAIGPIFRWSPIRSLGHFVTNPAIAWFSATLALIVWHIPGVFDLALRSDSLHKFEHATFFAAGLIFWWPVVQPWPSTIRWPRWSIPLYLFAATIPCDILSGFLAFCDRVVYSSYLSSPHLLGMSALQDQQCAAALMWVSVTIIYLLPAVVVTISILSPQGREEHSRVSPPITTLT